MADDGLSVLTIGHSTRTLDGAVVVAGWVTYPADPGQKRLDL